MADKKEAEEIGKFRAPLLHARIVVVGVVGCHDPAIRVQE